MTHDGCAQPQSDSTALILLSVALVFFAGVIAKYWFLSGG